MRDDFPAAVKDELAKRVGYLCSNPRCRQSTCGPKVSPSGTVSIGVAAHVSAASAGGPRYDDTLSREERSSAENGIWLCHSCAKLVDSDDSRYTVDKLREWKGDAEAAAAKALEHRRAPATGSQGVFLEAERLMPKLISEMRADVNADDSGLIREFVILPGRGVHFWHEKPRFEYYEREHDNLRLEVDWLQEMGAVIDVTPKNTPIYRMAPEFVDWLHDPKQPFDGAGVPRPDPDRRGEG